MTQSVADKTPLPDKARRRHTDPPGLWIAVAAISVTLHLLVFWLLRSNSYSLSQRSSSNPIPVEFVEIPSGRKAPSKAKPVSSKRASTTGKPTVVRSSKPATQENFTPKTSSVEDSNAIAFDNTKKATTSQPKADDTTQQSSQKRVVEQEAQPSPQQDATPEPTREPEPFIVKTPQAQQPEPTPEPTPEVTPQAQQPEPTPEPTSEVTPQAQQPEPTPEPTPEVTPQAQQPEPTPEPNTADSTNTDTQNQANQELGEQNQALNPENNSTDSTRTDSSPGTGEQPQGTPSSLPKPDGEVAVGKETPLQDIAPPVQPEQSPALNEQNGQGVGVATWDIEADKLKRDIPENLAQPEDNSRQKELNIVLSDAGGDVQPVDFLVWLTIDKQGNLIFIKVDEQIPLPQRSQYQKYADEIYQGQKFVPATNQDPVTGEKNPVMSNLPVRVRINRR
ncbi:hypothetical protein SAMD00079811_12720 [Scytonema sp. HK-05]|uniref:hypothetical protein n=1 Tax=Scytonema sp. HK-05 TaxID=1137095 RepID=UPI000937E753|nr:hypothetical protein [Scytonema sp. HK-05]OKH60305.1 hypothetical protein NIES2130_04355 [Scytonema sp. HK-05]BAY43691.1 hypothetical protein SAMD00079811_12720 [Scytonema sp. HK-05]